MHEAIVNYGEFILGQYRRRQWMHPYASHMKKLGARVRTNQFDGSQLESCGDVYLDFVAIVRAGRQQGFERLIVEVSVSERFQKLAELQARERVICHRESTSETERIHIYFPEHVWVEATFWNAKARTNLHQLHMTASELEAVKSLFEMTELSSQEAALVEKASRQI